MDINNKRKQNNELFNEFEDYYKLEDKKIIIYWIKKIIV